MEAIDKVYQEYLHGDGVENGDCFRASVASLLRMPLGRVPHFCGKAVEDPWWAFFQEWLEARGLTALHVKYAEDWVQAALGRAHFLLAGPSPRFPKEQHSVVACGTEIVHDPHPAGGGLLPPNEHHDWWVTVLIPLRPSDYLPRLGPTKPVCPDDLDIDGESL